MFLFSIGLITVAYMIIEILKEIYKCLQPFPNIQIRYGKDCWAVVTGATDGIGKGYCQILAQQNVNICMIVRNEEKAKKVIKELSQNSTSKFKIVIADFSQSHELGFFDKIAQQINSLDIGLLINNVGFATMAPLEKQKDQDIRDMITINCFPIVFLSKIVLPIMNNRKRSAIINLSSFTGRTPIPYNQVYSATKAFDDFFSKALALEVNNNIEIMSHRPMYVTTAMTNYKKGDGAITALQCAQGGLSRLGLEYETHGHWSHRLQGKLMMLIPEYFRTRLIRQGIRQILRKSL